MILKQQLGEGPGRVSVMASSWLTYKTGETVKVLCEEEAVLVHNHIIYNIQIQVNVSPPSGGL